jgi:hypothetical protein
MTPKAFKEYKDVDMQVGGEGMAGFYDKILPNAANKLGKKYGAKVGVTKVKGEAKGSAGGIASNGKEYWVPLPDGKTSPKFDSYVKADDWRSDYIQGNEEVWSLPITDAMRTQATKEGFPLFTGGKGGSLAGLLSQALTPEQPDDKPLNGILGR